MDLITSAGAAIAAGKALLTVVDVKSAVDTADLKLKVAELTSALADLKLSAVDMQDENNELRKKLTLRGRVLYEGTAYWEIVDGGAKDGPFCQRCYDVESRLVRLQIDRQFGQMACKQCKSGYAGSETAELKQRRGPAVSGSQLL